MKKVFSFNQNNNMRVKGERLRGILFDVNAFQADGTTVCDIANLNNTNIEMFVTRKGGQKKSIFNGQLNDFLTALYGQTMRYETCIKKLSSGYKMLIDFGGVLALGREDELVVELNPRSTTFTSLSTAQSTIECETVPAFGVATPLPKVETYAIGNGEVNLDEQLGSAVGRIVIVTDYTASYDASTKAKIVNVDLSARGFDKNSSANLLIAENLAMLEENPETATKNTVVYDAGDLQGLIHDVNLKATFDAGVDATAKVLVVRAQNI